MQREAHFRISVDDEPAHVGEDGRVVLDATPRGGPDDGHWDTYELFLGSPAQICLQTCSKVTEAELNLSLSVEYTNESLSAPDVVASGHEATVSGLDGTTANLYEYDDDVEGSWATWRVAGHNLKVSLVQVLRHIPEEIAEGPA